MIHIELTPEEASELREVLNRYLSDLRMEIVDTDSSGYKDILKEEKSVVAHILARLAEQMEPTA